MPLRDWFASRKSNTDKLDASLSNQKISDDELCKLWTLCFQCHEQLPTKDFTQNAKVCPKCDYHFRIGAWERIAQLTEQEEYFQEHGRCESKSFKELFGNLTSADPLGFEDTQAYRSRIEDARKKSKLNEAIVTGEAVLGNHRVALGVMDFAYLGGSMGSVVGEKVTRLIEYALEQRLPLVLFSSSGGARMQEGTFSLMQMVKTGAALARLHEAGLLFISVLTEPTFGGVTASYGTLGDIIIAEEGARIGFAGRRVIEQTIRQKLPADFQTAGYLLKYGQLDMVVRRPSLRGTLIELLRLHQPYQTSHMAQTQNINEAKKTPKVKAATS